MAISDSNMKEEHKTPFTTKFDELVEQTLDKWNVPGISISVIDGPDDFMKGYGIASLPDTPVTPETLFYAGSTTKAFCAAAASLLVDDDDKHKDFQWTAPISQLARDDFVLPEPYLTDNITIEDALCHRTGMPRHDKCYGGKNASVRDTVRRLRHLPMRRELRTASDYCNTMYIAVSHAIEVVTGEWLGDFLARRIWHPLGMTSTYFSLSDAQKSERPFAHGYVWDNQKKEQVHIPYMDFAEVSGAGCNISNIVDYTKWIRAMMNMEAPMSKKGYEALVKPLIYFDFGSPATMPREFYGLGWIMLWYQGEKVIYHPGGLLGFSAMVVYLPQRSWGAVMMTNSSGGAPVVQSLMWHMIDEVLQVPESKRVDWNELNEKNEKDGREIVKNARDRLYPGAATSIAPSLPIKIYAGTYSHPSYQTIELVVKDGNLHADVCDRTWPYFLDFEHVSGEHFVVFTSQTYGDGKQALKANFSIDASGQVGNLRIGFEEGVEMIEFVKIE